MSFATDLAKFAMKTEIGIDSVVRRVVVNLHDGFVFMTPVDTGFAQAGWMIAENSPPQGTPTKGKKNYPKPKANVSGLKAGGVIWIANNIPYIRHLEYGTASYGFSPKAPAGMVRVTIKNVKNNLSKAVKGL